MGHNVCLLITTLHIGFEKYLLQTAMKFPREMMESDGIYDFSDPNSYQWLYSKLPLHARGECIVKIEPIFDVVSIPTQACAW
jgi:hypothetical protein